ncbi:hypothetical protein AB0D49_29375 [Streptomyces sp. NPDC048290]|uniref:hypothetical protein n=1 Tax=Streptomyces sp. NPDC048290 TaxID=3155811 RepID=UPI00343709CA
MTGLTFLSWTREGLAAAGGTPDPTTGPMPARTTVTLRPRLTGRAPVDVTARLLGPGDVTGLDPAQILRCSPAPDTADAEPHLFPAVEFDRPDLPWMFTPAAATAEGRLRPWLVLVVLEAERAELLPGGGGLPQLVCARADLPDLAQSWAWAHAQVTTDDGAGDTDVDRLLAEEPDRTLSRLLCPRRLRPSTRYLAAVVPAFKAGRLAGLGRPVPDGDLMPAWPDPEEPRTQTTVDLPVYHHWSFTTGLDGDFESLVRRLVPRALPGDIGTRPMDIGDAGHGLPALPPGHPGRTLDLEGALRSAGTDPRPWHGETAAAFRAAYTTALDAGHDGTELTPPLYGGAQAGVRNLPSPQAGPTWLRQLNLDPRHRVAAALGAEVVRRHQEELVAAAWDQAAEVRRVNETLRQGQLARTVADSLHRRMPGAAASGSPAADDRLDARMLQMTTAVRAAVGYGQGTAAGELARNKEAAAAMEPALRRLMRPGGPLARRAAPTGTVPASADTAATELAASLARRTTQAVPDLTTPAGTVGVEDVAGQEKFEGLTPNRLLTRSWETAPTGPQETVPSDYVTIRWAGAAMPNRVFVVTPDGRLMSRVTQAGVPGWVDHGRPPGTTCATPPVAVRDLHVFVVGADGRLFQLHWAGDQWIWLTHGLAPGNRALRTGEGRFDTAVRYQPDTTAHPHQAVYAADEAGILWELTGRGTNWSWRNLGSPGGAGITGVRTVSDRQLHLVDRKGKLLRLTYNGTSWATTHLDAPGAGFTPDRGVPVPWGVYEYGVDTNGTLHLGVHMVMNQTLWIPAEDAPRISRLAGIGHDGQILLSTTDSRVITWGETSTVVGGGYAPVWGYQQSLPIAVYGSQVHAAGDGQLLAIDRAGDNTWRQLGRPTSGGIGDPAAPPPRHIRWRPPLGFLSHLLIGHVDAPDGPNLPYLRVGRSTDFDAKVRGGWQTKPALTGRMTADITQGFGIATADLNRSGRPDALMFWIEEFDHSGHVGNFGRYLIARDLDTNGDPAAWIGPVTMPTPMSTPTTASGGLTETVHVLAGSCTLADLDGDGNQELLVAYLGGIKGNRRLFLRIGWNIDPDTGIARGGWADSEEIPWPGRPSDSAPVVAAMDIAVADLNQDLRPELLVMLMEKTPDGVRGTYRIGWDINARGRITGTWGNTRDIPGTYAAVAGAGIAVADFSGSEKPDLAVLVLEDGPTANSASYRVGWDIQGTGTARSWSAPVPADAGSWYGWVNQGAGLALADLPGTVADRRADITRTFRAAATRHQNALLTAQSRADREREPEVRLRQLADAVRRATDPEHAVTARVTARIDGADLAGAGLPDPLGPLLVPPSFAQPLAELLTGLGSDHLLPGVQHIPPDTVTLLRANGPFIESFLAGANHELGRELLWREFPTDRRSTAFRHFWDARGTTEPGEEAPDVPPMRAWGRFSRLGETLRRPPGGDDAVVLLVRGDVVRRFPSLGLHARRALPPAVPGGPRRPGEQRLDPVFAGEIGADILFLGFPLTAAQALGSDTDPGWFFVFEEHATAPSFGLDNPPDGARHGQAPQTWQDVSWASVTRSADDLESLIHLGVTVPFGTGARPLYPGADRPEVSWGRNAAAVAHITLQQPVRVAHHASALLPVHGPGLRISHVRTRVPGGDRSFVREIAGRHPDGRWWRMTRAEALTALDGRQALYVESTPGHRVTVTAVADGQGGRYLRAAPDAERDDNLLSLPDIPDEAYATVPAAPGAARSGM